MSPESVLRRWLTVAALLVAQVMIILDQNIVNVALPAIRDDLGFSPSNLVWTVNAYVIPFGGLLLFAGRLGDLLNRKHVLMAGLALFVAASAWCGLAGSQSTLLVARFVQGIGGAVTAAGLLGMVVTVFDDPPRRAKAIGAFGFASAGGGALGTVVGGGLTESLSWHWVFFMNLPLGLAVLIAVTRLVRGTTGIGWRAGADVVGAIAVTGGIMAAGYAIVGADARGWTSPVTIGLSILAAALLAGFGLRQARISAPLLPVRILASRNVWGANLIQALMVAALFGFLFYTVLYLQQVLGFTPGQAGLASLPVPAVIATVSMALAPRLLTRFGPRPLVLAGLPLLAIGLALLAGIDADGDYPTDVLPSMIIMPVGFGLTMPSLMTLAMSEIAPRDTGVASGLFNTTQQVGGAVGLAILSTVVSSRTGALTAAGDTAAQAQTGGYSAAFWCGTGFLALAWLVAMTVLRTRHPEPSDAAPVPAAA